VALNENKHLMSLVEQKEKNERKEENFDVDLVDKAFLMEDEVRSLMDQLKNVERIKSVLVDMIRAKKNKLNERKGKYNVTNRMIMVQLALWFFVLFWILNSIFSS